MDRVWKDGLQKIIKIIWFIVDAVLIAVVALLLSQYVNVYNAIHLLVGIAVPLGIELPLACLLGFRRRRHLAYIAGVCAATQCSVNIVLFLLMEADGLQFVFWYIPLRLAGFVAEAVCYGVYLDRERGGRTGRKVLLAVIANILSGIANLTVSYDIAEVVCAFLGVV